MSLQLLKYRNGSYSPESMLGQVSMSSTHDSPMFAALYDACETANVLNVALEAVGEQALIPMKSQFVFCQSHIAPW